MTSPDGLRMRCLSGRQKANAFNFGLGFGRFLRRQHFLHDRREQQGIVAAKALLRFGTARHEGIERPVSRIRQFVLVFTRDIDRTYDVVQFCLPDFRQPDQYAGACSNASAVKVEALLAEGARCHHLLPVLRMRIRIGDDALIFFGAKSAKTACVIVSTERFLRLDFGFGRELLREPHPRRQACA